MSSFESLIAEIEKNRKLANEVIPEDVDPRTLTTKIGHIKRAKENLKDLFLDYRNHVKENAVFILLKGKQSDSFINVATSEYGCFSVGADELYEAIISQINRRHYTKQTSSPALFDMFMSVFNNICDDIGIIGYPAVLFEAKYRRMLESKEDILALVKEAFNDKVGSDLVGLYAIDKVARKAVNEGYSGTTIPIIISTEDKGLIDELEKSLRNINPNVFLVSTNKKQNTKSVEEKLVEIRSKIK